MNVMQVAKMLMDKHSPFRRIFALNKPGTTRADVLQVFMSFIHQSWIDRLINGIHKEFEKHATKLPPGHLLEIRLVPDLQRRQLKVVVESVEYGQTTVLRKPVFELYTRDITQTTIEQYATKFLGGAEALAEEFKITDFIKNSDNV